MHLVYEPPLFFSRLIGLSEDIGHICDLLRECIQPRVVHPGGCITGGETGIILDGLDHRVRRCLALANELGLHFEVLPFS